MLEDDTWTSKLKVMGEGAFYAADIHSNNLMFCLGTLDKFVKLKGMREGAFYTADTHSGNLIFRLGIYNG